MWPKKFSSCCSRQHFLGCNFKFAFSIVSRMTSGWSNPWSIPFHGTTMSSKYAKQTDFEDKNTVFWKPFYKKEEKIWRRTQKTKGLYHFTIFCSSALKLRSSDERPGREREEIQPSPTPLPQAPSLAWRHNSYPSGTCTVFVVRYCLCRPILIKPILFSVCWWIQIVMSNVKRYCFVPGCRNTTFKTPQKRFISVPSNVLYHGEVLGWKLFVQSDTSMQEGQNRETQCWKVLTDNASAEKW